jgi:hypothetical protein
METYRIVNIAENSTVPGKESVSYEEASLWIDQNGGDCPLCEYTIVKN